MGCHGRGGGDELLGVFVRSSAGHDIFVGLTTIGVVPEGAGNATDEASPDAEAHVSALQELFERTGLDWNKEKVKVKAVASDSCTVMKALAALLKVPHHADPAHLLQLALKLGCSAKGASSRWQEVDNLCGAVLTLYRTSPSHHTHCIGTHRNPPIATHSNP